MPKAKVAPGKPGRPATGKRSDPTFRQTSLWLKRETLAKAQRQLIMPEGKYDFSELVQDLLDKWLTAGGKIPRKRVSAL